MGSGQAGPYLTWAQGMPGGLGLRGATPLMRWTLTVLHQPERMYAAGPAVPHYCPLGCLKLAGLDVRDAVPSGQLPQGLHGQGAVQALPLARVPAAHAGVGQAGARAWRHVWRGAGAWRGASRPAPAPPRRMPRSCHSQFPPLPSAQSLAAAACPTSPPLPPDPFLPHAITTTTTNARLPSTRACQP